jgi:hypothetical protein
MEDLELRITGVYEAIAFAYHTGQKLEAANLEGKLEILIEWYKHLGGTDVNILNIL